VKSNLRGGFGWATYSHWGQTVGARVFAAQAGSSPAADGTHTQWEVNADLRHGPADLVLGYYKQDHVDGVKGDSQTNWVTELVVAATRNVLLTGRYEAQDTKSGGASVPGTDSQAVGNVSWYLLPNISLGLEYSALNTKEAGGKDDRVILGFNVGL